MDSCCVLRQLMSFDALAHLYPLLNTDTLGRAVEQLAAKQANISTQGQSTTAMHANARCFMTI